MLIARESYSILDLISDIGGIQALLISAIAYFLAIWNFNYFDNYMVARLYKVQREEQQT